MTYYAVQYTYVTNADALTAVRPEHRDYLRKLGPAGLVAAGAYTDAETPGALLLFRSDSRRDVESLLDKDPFWTRELITERRIEQWNPTIGIFEA